MSEYLTPGYLTLYAMIYLVVYGVAGMYVAAQAGRPETEGFLLAVLFGPFGLVVAAVLPPRAIEGGTVAAEDGGELRYDRAVRENLDRTPTVAPPTVPPNPPPRPRRLLGEVRE